MSDIALRTVGLGKMYRIGGEKAKYRTLRETLMQTAKRPIERIRHPGAATHHSEMLWALRDIDLEVKHGQALGIIGRNGAGKTTLLKVLSRITEPTEGRVEIRGRVASLLEVGTGFHAELTGRENIYLNGAILGMKRADIKRKFDEIVEFSEIGRFLDTPVKRYSSGMYVRLAFAVAAHLDPEILIIDEVLAVGDASFQKKCLAKMSGVARGGRTVLFVSHNMGAVNRLCDRGIWLDQGGVVMQDTAVDTVRTYLNAGNADVAERSWAASDQPGDDALRLTRVRICQPSGVTAAFVDITEPFEVEIETQVEKPEDETGVGFHVLTPDGNVVMHSGEVVSGLSVARTPGRWVSRCRLPAYVFNAGDYLLSVDADVPYRRIIFSEDGVLRWRVEATSEGMGRYHTGSWMGVVGPGLGGWSVEKAADDGEWANDAATGSTGTDGAAGHLRELDS